MQRRARNRAVIGLVLGALALFQAPLAEAQSSGSNATRQEPTPEDVREAGEQFNLGRAAYKEEDYVTAAEHFEKADSLAPNPKVLWLAIDSRQRAGHEPRAATLAALATQLYPGDATFEPANELLRNALQVFSRLKVECDEPCTVLVDTRLVHGPPMEKRFVFLEPGDYRIKAFWSDERSAMDGYHATAGQNGHLEFQAPPVGAPEASSVAVSDSPASALSTEAPLESGAGAEVGQESKPLGPAVFWTGVALTAGLAGVSIWSGVDAQKNPGPDAVRANCVNQGPECPTYQEGLRKQTRTNILWGATAGVGVVTALIGAIWTDWGVPSVPASPDVGVSALPIRPFLWLQDGVGVGAVGRF